jgi:hypothetical protein
VHAITPNVDLLLGFPKAGVLLQNVDLFQNVPELFQKAIFYTPNGFYLERKQIP